MATPKKVACPREEYLVLPPKMAQLSAIIAYAKTDISKEIMFALANKGRINMNTTKKISKRCLNALIPKVKFWLN